MRQFLGFAYCSSSRSARLFLGHREEPSADIHIGVNERVPAGSRAFRTYWGLGFLNHPELEYTAYCPGAPPVTTAIGVTSVLLTPVDTQELYRMTPSGSELKGSFGPSEYRYEWHLLSVPDGN